MKKSISILFTVFILFVSCQHRPTLSHDYLVGHWYVTEIEAENVELFGQPFNTDMTNQEQSFEFTKTEMYMHQRNLTMQASDTSLYEFSSKDSSLTLIEIDQKERLKLKIIGQDKFIIEDNMGVALHVKKRE